MTSSASVVSACVAMDSHTSAGTHKDSEALCWHVHGKFQHVVELPGVMTTLVSDIKFERKGHQIKIEISCCKIEWGQETPCALLAVSIHTS